MEEGGQHWQQQSQVSQAKDNDNLHKITTTGVGRTLGTGGLGQGGGEVTRMSLMASVAAMVFRLALTNTHKDIIHRYKGYPVENTRKKPSTPRVLSAAVGCPTISRKRDSLQHYANAAHTQNHIFNPVFFSLSLAMHSMLAISYHNIVQGS